MLPETGAPTHNELLGAAGFLCAGIGVVCLARRKRLGGAR